MIRLVDLLNIKKGKNDIKTRNFPPLSPIYNTKKGNSSHRIVS